MGALVDVCGRRALYGLVERAQVARDLLGHYCTAAARDRRQSAGGDPN